MTTQNPVIVLFHQDLRLSDHAALSWAAARGPVVPLFVWNDALPVTVKPGGAARWALREALKDLSENLAKRSISLVIRRGHAIEQILELAREIKAQAVSWHRRYETPLATEDEALIAALTAQGIEAKRHEGSLLFPPETIRTGSGTPFKVYTPFSKACRASTLPTPPLPAPSSLNGLMGLKSLAVDDLNLLPKTAQWPKNLSHNWTVSEAGAADCLTTFLTKGAAVYKDKRDRPDIEATSKLSPYLHHGLISPRQVWHAVENAVAQQKCSAANAEKFLNEILWREFSWHLLHHFPSMIDAPMQPNFAHFPWRDDPKNLVAWQKGLTGYPIIDAGMRQLWQTGWMHNRVRMIVASFLVKDLLIDWREGMAWFWDTLIDADYGSNTASWQWVAGCGADAAPYFRIFNPMLQSAKFDPDGAYIKRWVPELATLPATYIHEPWQAPSEVLTHAGIKLDFTYPRPIIDHSAARSKALAALAESKGVTVEIPRQDDLFG